MTELEVAAKNVRIMFKTALLEQVSRALQGNTTPKDIVIQKQVAKILGIAI